MAHNSRARVAGETASASNEVRLQQVRSVPRAASAGASCRGLGSHDRQSVGRREAALRAVGAGRPAAPRSEVDYKRFNSSNISIRHWSWNYRSCWHQTCPPVDTHCWVWIWHPLQILPVMKTGRIATARCCLTRCAGIGQFACLLPTLAVVAVYQAPSPVSNPDSPLPVIATVVHYTTVLS
jgi:hypothetical protein